MSSALRFIGRLIFVTLLLSSAVLKIKQPGSYTAEFTNGYNSIRGLHSSVSEVVPKVEQITTHLPMETLVRVVGAVEALTALLIVFGDRLGGVLLLIQLVVCGIIHHLPTVRTLIAKQKIEDALAFMPHAATYLTLLGFAFVFMSRGHIKRRPISA